jgi:hypothetical protein
MELEEEKKETDEEVEKLQKDSQELIKKYENLNKPNYFEMMMNGEFSNIDNNKSTNEEN